MKNFYTISKMRISILDINEKEILSYPEEICDFCCNLRKEKALHDKCVDCDTKAFSKAKAAEDIYYYYYCHQNLVEAVSPIKINNKVIGFLMIGQVRGEQSACNSGDILYEKLPRYSNNEIMAYLNILEALCLYIINKRLIKNTESILEQIDNIIDKDISCDLTIKALCKRLGVTRSTLYRNLGIGFNISAYIKNRRLHKAESLLRDTDLAVSLISEQCGYADYNYFIKVFKRKYGLSPLKYRKKFRIDEH